MLKKKEFRKISQSTTTNCDFRMKLFTHVMILLPAAADFSIFPSFLRFNHYKAL